MKRGIVTILLFMIILSACSQTVHTPPKHDVTKNVRSRLPGAGSVLRKNRKQQKKSRDFFLKAVYYEGHGVK